MISTSVMALNRIHLSIQKNGFLRGWAGSPLLYRLFSSCHERALLSSCGAQASHSTASLVEHGLWDTGFSHCSSWVLEHRLSSCGTQAWLQCSMWGFPRPGIKPGILYHWSTREAPQNLYLQPKLGYLAAYLPSPLEFFNNRLKLNANSSLPQTSSSCNLLLSWWHHSFCC